jgi:hypothetical protein
MARTSGQCLARRDWSHWDHLRLLGTFRRRRSRDEKYTALFVERLESRTMLAGDLGVAGAGDVSDATTVDIKLELTSSDGSPLTELVAGQEFVLHVYVQDARAEGRGVFSAYLDIAWDSAKAVATGPIDFGAAYENGRNGESVLEGLIDEGGAFGGVDELGAAAQEVFSVPLQAVSAGELVFSADPADVSPLHDVTVYGSNDRVPSEDVSYGSVSVTVGEGADGTAGGDASSDHGEAVAITVQSSADEAMLQLIALSMAPSASQGTSVSEPDDSAPVEAKGPVAAPQGWIAAGSAAAGDADELSADEAAEDGDAALIDPRLEDGEQGL